MNRELTREYFEIACRHVRQGETLIAEQRYRIADLEAKGRDTQLARELLRQLETAHNLSIADRTRLEAELAQIREGEGQR